MKQWVHLRLGATCKKIGSGATPRGGENVYVNDGTAIIRSQNVYNGLFDPDGLAYLSADHADQLKSVTVESRDVLLNITGDSVARCCQVPDSVLPARVNQHVSIVRPRAEELLPEFLFYYFISPLAQRYLLSLSGRGGTRKALTKRMIEDLEIPCPPLAVQSAIVGVLSAYDDLIENHRQRVWLLERAARLIYEEWFVHLRFPGHEQDALRSRTPTRWKKQRIADVCQTVGGGTPSTTVTEYWDGDITWVVPSDITKNDSLVLLDSERKITEKGLRESSARLVPKESILMTSRASVGFFALTDREVATNQGFINIIPHDERMRMYLLFNLMSRVAEIRANAKGTTYPEISKGRFRAMNIVIPGGALAEEFSDITLEVVRQVRCLKRSISQLKNARDAFLPRVMNGEIAV